MATIGASNLPQLALVRRLEAVGFRAWPAASVHYDGSWAVRLTASHPSRRLNSVNPLDPADNQDLEPRIARIESRFASYDRPLVFRLSPLAPSPLEAYFDAEGWQRVAETRVLMASLDEMDLDSGIDQLPSKNIGRFVDNSIRIRNDDQARKSGLTEVLESIRPPSGLFLMEEDKEPIACALCVHDNDMAGLFDVGVRAESQGMGYGRSIVRSALRWAKQQGAKSAWLQVEADNKSANALYQRLGFHEVYSYVYRIRKDNQND